MNAVSSLNSIALRSTACPLRLTSARLRVFPAGVAAYNLYLDLRHRRGEASVTD